MKKFMPMGLTIWSNKVDGSLYKKPNMTKALFFFEFFGDHDFFVGRGIPGNLVSTYAWGS